MPRGKRGPRPDVKPSKKKEDREDRKPVMMFACAGADCTFLGRTFELFDAHSEETGHAAYEMKQVLPEVADDKTAEEIVGADNVVDVSSQTDEPERQPSERQGYKCSLPGCTFQTSYLTEMEEHVNGTGHGSYVTDTLDPAETQMQLPNIVRRNVEIPVPEAQLTERRKELSECFLEVQTIEAEKKVAVDGFNARIKPLEERMKTIGRVLSNPITYERADCEWRLIDGENARGLYRLDSGECIEKEALDAEAYQREVEKANAQNAAPEQVAEKATA